MTTEPTPTPESTRPEDAAIDAAFDAKVPPLSDRSRERIVDELQRELTPAASAPRRRSPSTLAAGLLITGALATLGYGLFGVGTMDHRTPDMAAGSGSAAYGDMAVDTRDAEPVHAKMDEMTKRLARLESQARPRVTDPMDSDHPGEAAGSGSGGGDEFAEDPDPEVSPPPRQPAREGKGEAEGLGRDGRKQQQQKGLRRSKKRGEGAERPAELTGGEKERKDDATRATATPSGKSVKQGDGEKDPTKSKTTATKKPKTWKPAAARPGQLRLEVGDGAKAGLPLKLARTEIHVDGFRARVVLDLDFYNDRNRQLEGSFQLRLPNGASPYFLAFGAARHERRPAPANQVASAAETAPEQLLASRKTAWVQPKVARMVPRIKAANAYIQTTRRRVDPALMEWAGPGMFSAKIFPIMPNKTHRVVIAYDVDLTPKDGARELSIALPEAQARELLISVAETKGQQIKVIPSVDAVRRSGRLYYSPGNPKDHQVRVRVGNGPSLLTYRDPRVGPLFAATLEAPAEKGEASGAGRAVFMLDSSLSARETYARWIHLLDNILTRNERLKSFALLRFDVTRRWYKNAFVANNAENRAALKRWLDGTVLEGATDVEAGLSEAARPAWLKGKKTDGYDVFLLSDAAATWGRRDPRRLVESAKDGHIGAIFGYRLGVGPSDDRALAALAQSSGGAVFAATNPDRFDKVAVAHATRPWKLRKVEVDGTKDLILAGRPRVIYPDQQLTLVGRGAPATGSIVKLTLRRSGETKTIEVPLGSGVSSALAGRIYGQVAVGELELVPTVADEPMTAYARHFRITGKTCSLLMLESQADYDRFKIQSNPEKDARLIRQTFASSLIFRALDEAADTRSDQRRALLRWFERLQNTPGVNLRLNRKLLAVLAKLDASAFRVPRKALDARDVSVPKNYQELLSQRRIPYEACLAEADRRLTAGGPDAAVRAFSSLVERSPGDLVLLRDVAMQTLAWGKAGEAHALLRMVGERRPWEPGTWLALGRCAAATQRHELAIAYYEVALAGRWQQRFRSFRAIAGPEYRRLIEKLAREKYDGPLANFVATRRAPLTREFPASNAEMEITIQWTTDRTDVDLHVVEPTGETCYYSNRKTRIGGRLTQDVTEGFGPEMYSLRKATPGVYKIKVHYFAQDRNRSKTRTRVHATIRLYPGTPRERVIQRTITLRAGKQMSDVVEVAIK